MIGDRNARSKATEIVALRGEEPASYVPNSFNRILNSKYRIEDRHRVAAAVDTLVYFSPSKSDRVYKNAGLAAELSELARYALQNSVFNGTRWILRYLSGETADELIALKLARASKSEVYVTIAGMGVRAVVVRPGQRQGTVSE